eukprot:CAMPEP_0179065896 /NCGR_PEP_ID=MMETSP0796-20121207/28699_1 /TAXON_ID=73915 /ORGANISM="Pyrodinium bahamense, Strain pbaha01" /LENGTH=69 /DNA_ID=CAMNT_0020762887 /DNA_START=83 /DNA_END=289 /DNA_ORIENTATION=+
MGGPCTLVDEEGATTGLAPPCTDNFQIASFMLDGVQWCSVEQCFQTLKFTDEAKREAMMALKPEPGEGD